MTSPFLISMLIFSNALKKLLFDHLNLLVNNSLRSPIPLFVTGYSKREISDLENEIIEFSGIHDFIDRPIRTYSAGMRARLGFAIVSNLEPDILLLDEVMSVGDAEFRKKSREKIEELINGEATVIIVSLPYRVIKIKRRFYLPICNYSALIYRKNSITNPFNY